MKIRRVVLPVVCLTIGIWIGLSAARVSEGRAQPNLDAPPVQVTLTPAPGRAGRVITYSVATKGPVDSDVAEFRQSVSRILGDSRGWSLGNTIKFREVPTGGDFTMWLADSSTMTAFSPGCDDEWSCRSGRNVIVNDKRWLRGSPTLKMPLASYRSLIVNHEVGHWLGLDHGSCSEPGKRAGVMQQQSKPGGLQGCLANEWPLESEKAQIRESS